MEAAQAIDDRPDWVTGDQAGLPIPTHIAALRAGGAAYLTGAMRRTGMLDGATAVAEIVRLEEWAGGGTGKKAQLTLRYQSATDLPTDLFVKFSRNFDDPIFDRTRYHMQPEVRLALLSREPGFPVAVPRCLLADFHDASGSAILVTERIAYDRAPIEPHYPKCFDHALPAPLDHYRALIAATARLAGAHKGGRLPASVSAQFPFDRAAAEAGNPIPEPERLGRKLARLEDFAGRFPLLFPAEVTASLDDFAAGALLFQAHEAPITRFFHADPDLIALCHWNANIDNAWFWREADGALACGLMDWGSVGQMSVAMTLWGCLSGAEPWLWERHLGELLDLFVREFAAAGGPALDRDRLALHLELYVAMMGLAWLLDAPARILREIPALAPGTRPHDPELLANETARVQLAMLTNVLNLWRTRTITRTIVDRFAAG